MLEQLTTSAYFSHGKKGVTGLMQVSARVDSKRCRGANKGKLAAQGWGGPGGRGLMRGRPTRVLGACPGTVPASARPPAPRLPASAVSLTDHSGGDLN